MYCCASPFIPPPSLSSKESQISLGQFISFEMLPRNFHFHFFLTSSTPFTSQPSSAMAIDEGSIEGSSWVIRWLFLILLPSATPSEEGSRIGKFEVHHHAVGGQVFAINETSVHIKGFTYDGLGKDAYFWAGQNSNPSSQGFIIPDEHGRTNVLEKYDNRDIILTLPDGKKINEIQWIAVFDLSRLVSYGDVYIPDGFAPPGTHHLGPLTSRSDDVNSDDVELLDTKRIVIKGLNLHRDDDQEVLFWVGKGHLPSPRGHTLIPDENGYFEPLRIYNHEDVTLTLPGDLKLESIDWLAVYDVTGGKPLAYATIPSELNVPPNLDRIEKYEYSLPNCEQLHADLQVSWDVVGQTITIEMIGLIEPDEWMGFGISGNENSSQMIGSDVGVGFIQNSKGFAYDLNIDAKSICTTILDVKHGVCQDAALSHSDALQLLEHRRVNSVTGIKYRRQLTVSEPNDKEFRTSAPISIIYAIGKLFPNGQLGFHRVWNKVVKKIDFVRSPPLMECSDFVVRSREEVKPWGPFLINDGKLRVFSAKLGPAGGIRGYEGITGLPSPGLSWYIHGYLAPELIMQRGYTYSFRVEGGNSPQNVQSYHPLVISTEPNSQAPRSIILAGVELTRRGQSRPTAAGRLCLWMHTKFDRRLDSSDLFPTFEKYRNSLKLKCENNSEPGILEVSPNSSWPDVVYYGSSLAPNMGWKIHIVDSIGYSPVSSSSSGSPIVYSFYFITIPLLILIINYPQLGL